MNTVKLLAVGDICFSVYRDVFSQQSPDFPFLNVHDVFNAADVILANLEGPLSNKGQAIKRGAEYSPPNTLDSIKSAGINILSLANNHIFDYGYSAFEDTINILIQNNISYFGAGKNLDEARRPAVLQINDVSIGFLGYAWDLTGAIKATQDSFGTAPLEEEVIVTDVKRLKDKVDVVVVSFHWSYEREKYPLPCHRNMAHNVLDAGATLILGHHPHILQGIEEYRNGIIAYSLGNFIFPFTEQYEKAFKRQNRYSMILDVCLSSDGIQGLSAVPTKSNEYFQPCILSGKDKERLLSNIGKLSGGFGRRNYSCFYRTNRVRKDVPDASKPKIFDIYDRLAQALSLGSYVLKHPYLLKQFIRKMTQKDK